MWSSVFFPRPWLSTLLCGRRAWPGELSFVLVNGQCLVFNCCITACKVMFFRVFKSDCNTSVALLAPKKPTDQGFSPASLTAGRLCAVEIAFRPAFGIERANRSTATQCLGASSLGGCAPLATATTAYERICRSGATLPAAMCSLESRWALHLLVLLRRGLAGRRQGAGRHATHQGMSETIRLRAPRRWWTPPPALARVHPHTPHTHG